MFAGTSGVIVSIVKFKIVNTEQGDSSDRLILLLLFLYIYNFIKLIYIFPCIMFFF